MISSVSNPGRRRGFFYSPAHGPYHTPPNLGTQYYRVVEKVSSRKRNATTKSLGASVQLVYRWWFSRGLTRRTSSFAPLRNRGYAYVHLILVRASRPIRGLRQTAIVVFCVCAIGPALQAQSKAKHSTIAHAPAKRISLVGVPNFGEVTPTLYRGAQPSDKGFKNLAQMGIDVIVDFRGLSLNQERHEAAANNIKLILLSWDCRSPSDKIAANFLQILKENAGKKIFVHCYGGIDRTGAMIAVYRMANEGWTEPEAMNEMHAFGYAFMHHIWCHAVEQYVKKFPQNMQENPQLVALHAGAPPHAAN